MGTGTVVAICAVIIALASLSVSVIEARAVRDHRRRSVRPLLQLGFRTHRGETAGLVPVNSGIGPRCGDPGRLHLQRPADGPVQ